MEVDIKRKHHLVVIDNDILAQIGEAAKKQSVSSEELINTWLSSPFHKYSDVYVSC